MFKRAISSLLKITRKHTAFLAIGSLLLAVPVVTSSLQSANAAPPTGFSVARDSATGLLTATWSASSDANLIGYKVYVDASGKNKSASQNVGLVTTTKICFPFNGNTTAYIAIRTTATPDPVFNAATTSVWASYAMGSVTSPSGTSCAANTTTQYTFSISFDSNTADSGAMSTISGTGYSVTLPDNAFTKTGSQFTNWHTTQAGTGGTSYNNGQTINLTGNLGPTTLYAQWATPVTITFHINDGGADVTTTQTVGANTATALTLNSFSRSGYAFARWDRNSGGTSGTSYTNGQSVTLASSIDLYAIWAAPVIITFYKNDGGSAVTETQSVGSGAPTALRGNTFTRVGYTFSRWDTSTAGDGVSYTAGQSVTITSPLSLYAVWTTNTNNFAYDGNGSTSGSAPSGGGVKAYGVTITAASNTYTKTGYTFASWNTVADGSGTPYNPADTFSMPDNDVTLFAQWTSNSPAPSAPVCEAPRISSIRDANFAINHIYFYVGGEFTMTVYGSNVNSYSLIGTLPAGFTFDAASGKIYGTLTTEGKYSFSIKATGACGSDTYAASIDVDKATPNAISCRFDFSNGKLTLSSLGLAELKKCVDKAKELSPNQIDPSIIFTGGALPTPTDPTGCDTANLRYQAILDALVELDLSPEIMASLFNGSGSTVEIIFTWVRPVSI